MSDVVGKLWGFCNTLRHDGVDYGDYIEQLTYLLFLKMSDEKGAEIPKEYAWKVLREKAGTNLTDFYVDAHEFRPGGAQDLADGGYREFEDEGADLRRRGAHRRPQSRPGHRISPLVTGGR